MEIVSHGLISIAESPHLTYSVNFHLGKDPTLWPQLERARKLPAYVRDKGVANTLRLLLRKCRDTMEGWRWDCEHGVETRKPVSGSRFGLGGDYSASGKKFFERLGVLKLDWSKFAFVDLGCGKGKVLLMAAQFPFMRIVGVEFADELAQKARRNIASYHGPRRCPALEVITSDGAQYEFPPDPLVLYCFDSFPETVLRVVLKNLQHSLEVLPREVYLIYTHPVKDAVFEEFKFLQLIDTGENHRSYRSLLPRP